LNRFSKGDEIDAIIISKFLLCALTTFVASVSNSIDHRTDMDCQVCWFQTVAIHLLYHYYKLEVPVSVTFLKNKCEKLLLLAALLFYSVITGDHSHPQSAELRAEPWILLFCRRSCLAEFRFFHGKSLSNFWKYIS